MTHGVDGGDVVGAHVAVVYGGFRGGPPVVVVAMGVRPDLGQQTQLQRTSLIVPPAAEGVGDLGV